MSTDNTISTLNNHIRTRIGCWNIRTLRNQAKLEELDKVLPQNDISICGLSETRWTGSGNYTTNAGHTILFSGPPENTGQHGVAIYVSKLHRRCLLSWQPVSDRIVAARFKNRSKNISIVQCYAPTEVADAATKDEFYEQLNTVLQEIPMNDIKILMGDLNAQVGQDMTECTGRYSLKLNTNDNGQRLIDLCTDERLVIGGTLFPHKDIHKYTWTSPDGKTRNQIDHICISKEWRTSLLNVKNRRGAILDTDHHLVIAEVRLKLSRAFHSRSTTRRRLNVEKTREQETRRNLMGVLETANNPTMEDIRKYCEATVGFSAHDRAKPLSDRTWRLIESRNALKLLTVDNNDTQSKEELRLLNRGIKKSARADKRAALINIASEAELAARRGDSGTIYKCVRCLCGGKQVAVHGVKDTDGRVLTGEEDLLRRWRQHFAGEMTEETAGSSDPHHTAEEDVHPPSIHEIFEAITHLKNGKAAGDDGVPAEIFQVDPAWFAEYLYPKLKTVWRKEEVPESWKNGLIVKLPKKGDLTRCENWRGITVLNITLKILASIIHGQMYPIVEGQMRDEQAAYIKSRRCTDHIVPLRHMFEQAEELHAILYAAFVDYRRAFDTLKHSAIWTALEESRVPQKLIAVTKALYTGATSRVVHKGALSEPINLTCGVRQGCPLSPLLFIVTLNRVLQRAFDRPRGLQLGPFNKIEGIEFADDLALMAQTAAQLQKKLDRLTEESSAVGLEINVAKTKVMCSQAAPDTVFKIGHENIENVESFRYLGAIITQTGGSLEDARARIATARGTMARMRKVWAANHISRATKVRIFTACVLPSLLYGCESWSAVAAFQECQVFVNKCLRRICRVFWPRKVRNEKLWEMTGVGRIESMVERRRWAWVGHQIRRGGKTMAALRWNPAEGQRRPGRPAPTLRRRMNEVLAANGMNWRQANELAKERDSWRSFVNNL